MYWISDSERNVITILILNLHGGRKLNGDSWMKFLWHNLECDKRIVFWS